MNRPRLAALVPVLLLLAAFGASAAATGARVTAPAQTPPPVADRTGTPAPPVTPGETRLLRFPDIHGDKVAFTYAGDIWSAPANGGVATRLTAHPGMELFPKFSPDGQWIAFTAQYDGDEQVYVMPAGGGTPRQLTFYPARGPLTPRWGWDHQVYGWTRDGNAILFRSHRDSWALNQTRLYTVAFAGGPSEPLPMPESGSGDFSPDGSQVVYSPKFRDFRPEKRYSGGTVNTLWLFDLKANAARKLIETERSNRDPLWVDPNTIVFNSDRDGTFRLYAYDLPSGKITRLTDQPTWDVRWPGTDHAGRVVYELAGGLQVLDLRSGASTPLAIRVLDDGLWKRPARIVVAGNMEDAALSPKGERAVFTARGDIFSAPIEKGDTRNLTRSSGAHDKFGRWSPDGSRIAFISDDSGEDELYVAPQDGSAKPQKLTSGGRAQRYAPEWSPDGRRIAFGDKDGKIFVYSFDNGSLTQIVDAPRGQIFDYTWSPRSHYLAFSMTGTNNYNSVYVWSERDTTIRRVTDPMFNAGNPAWDPDGDYLYYLGDHQFAPQLSTVEFNFATSRMTGIYALALRAAVKAPYPPQSDEVTIGPLAAAGAPPAKPPAAGGAPAAGPAPAAAPAPAEMTVEFDGLGARVARVPVDFDNIGGLGANKGHLLYLVVPAPFYGRGPATRGSLRIFSAKDRKETTLLEGANGYALSADGSKVLVAADGSFTLMDASPTGAQGKKTVSTAGLVVDRVPVQEWAQIFNEVWRRYRDWFYVENMQGYDWDALRRQYEPLLRYVAHRSDLNYVISEMIAELTIQHAYIEGGDFTMPARPRYGLPGARFALDRASGRYRFTRILAGQNEEDIYRSPLTEIGVDVKPGDYLLAVEGEALTPDEDPYRLFRNRADRPVHITVSAKPTMDGSRVVAYNPVASEVNLLYFDWTAESRRRVDRLSGGRLGYIHLPDMGAQGIYEFIKWYYAQVNREGMVVDVRANGGGNVSRMLIERFARRWLAVDFSRTDDMAETYPDGVFIGPKVSILNAYSASDGDIFPAMFKESGLGPLIGQRSWGGVVGISGHGPLIDGGTVFVPESGMASRDGTWIIEGHGVDPDIPVENDPASVIAGRDPQLERAVAELMKAVTEHPVRLPAKPAGPIKTGRG